MWISSIAPVRKKNGQIRVCVDFRDLNNACPKDDFPLTIAELMINATIGHEALSFMDGLSGYNQIRMAPADEELTAFRTPKASIRKPILSIKSAQDSDPNCNQLESQNPQKTVKAARLKDRDSHSAFATTKLPPSATPAIRKDIKAPNGNRSTIRLELAIHYSQDFMLYTPTSLLSHGFRIPYLETARLYSFISHTTDYTTPTAHGYTP
ncbi:hypothetical protein Sango_1723800 [Sesamum angolense]|uniref:Reverse transcriptase domain-containing protein n=1 Tax=Sesamum angolense TaxID=2727404 RepID=A0AAE1WLM9_9LAMI|nr:hypothetical protein Sango_1723800 [Sesamum angolense]